MNPITLQPWALAAIAALQILGLAIIQSLTGWRKDVRDTEARRKDKEEDYARQDVVAARLATIQSANIMRTEEVARVAALANKNIAIQLKTIHTLVNSDMTAARTAERDSLKLLVIALKRIGQPEDIKELKEAEDRIEELNQILADRMAAQLKVDAEAAENKANAKS